MLKASALYMVIVIALVMAVICSSLIVSAYFYKLQYQKTFRQGQLQNNLGSGINLLLESNDDYTQSKAISLFGNSNDTVQLRRVPWGLFTVGIIKAFIQQDTLARAFTLANTLDSAQWAALYVIDEDRSLSVSGKTAIRGNAYIPKAGIQEAYVNNQAYQGDKRLINGTRHDSKRTLPALNDIVLHQLEQSFGFGQLNSSAHLPPDSVTNSFLNPTVTYDLGKQVHTITHALQGNIIIRSDTALVIDGSARLYNVLVFARSITVKSGFKGNCQMFATDSISIGQNCTFNYPSALGVLRFEDKVVQGQEKLVLEDNCRFSGAIFTYEKAKNELLPLIDLGKNTTITGQVYSQGMLNYKDQVVINGSAYTSRFLYQTDYTRYENYLINIKVDGPALSPYYLTSDLLPAASTTKKILQWLNVK